MSEGAEGAAPVTQKPEDETPKPKASGFRAFFNVRNITLFLVLLALVWLAMRIIAPLVQQRVTTVVEAETPYMEWVYDGETPVVLNLPDGEDMSYQLDPETGDLLKSAASALIAPSLELTPGARVRIVHTHPCLYEFHVAMSDQAGAVPPQLMARGGQVRVLDGDDDLPVFRYAPKVCAQPVELSIERATGLTMGSLMSRRIGAGLYGQTVASGRIEIFNTAWVFGGRYKMSETELGAGDTVRLMALPNQTSLTSKWNGQIQLGGADEAGQALMQVKVSSVQNTVNVRKYVGDYVVDTNLWQSLYTQPAVQFFIVIIGFLAALHGMFKDGFKNRNDT